MSTSLLTAESAGELPPLLLTVPEAGRFLAISKTALRRLIWRGEFTPVRIGRRVRFTVAQLERFITDRTAHAAPEP
jgi:excisionase family DNA binding protein